MSSFISAGTPKSDTTEQPLDSPLENNGFWPDIQPSDFRATHRLDSTITQPRIESALKAAMITVNRVLRHWQQAKVEAGYPHHGLAAHSRVAIAGSVQRALPARRVLHRPRQPAGALRRL